MMSALLLSSATTEIPAVRSSKSAAAAAIGPRTPPGGAPGALRSGAGAGVVTGAPPIVGAAVAEGMPGAPGRNVGWPETASGNGPDDTVAVVVREMEATRPCSCPP